MNETVKFWQEEFLAKYPNPTRRNIQEEINEVRGAIVNIRLWILGTDDHDEEEAFISNMEDYEAWLAILTEMLKKI